MVLVAEVAGRWSEECRSFFLSLLARAKVRDEGSTARARQAWSPCPTGVVLQVGHVIFPRPMLARSAVRTVASSLLETRRGQGSDGRGGSLFPRPADVLADAMGEHWPWACACRFLFLSSLPFFECLLSAFPSTPKKQRDWNQTCTIEEGRGIS